MKEPSLWLEQCCNENEQCLDRRMNETVYIRHIKTYTQNFVCSQHQVNDEG